MSSLAAVQADGYYYPPDWTPDRGSASLRARVGTKGAKGALGKKNAKLKPKQPTVRFEMPFDVGCSRCDATIAKGVRFNAAKTAVGKYHSTTVWRFEMKTACCGNRLEIRTDPKNGDFAVEAGARRRLGAADAGAFGTNRAVREGTMEVEVRTREDRALLVADGMARLERARGLEAASAERRDDARVAARRARDFGAGDYDANRAARRAHRAERNRLARREAERDALGLPESVALLPRDEEDAEAARRAFRGGRAGDADDAGKRKRGDAFDAFARARARSRATIRESSIFSGPGVVSNATDATRALPRAPGPREGKGYVPAPSAAARAGGARGVQVRRALVAAQRTSPRKPKDTSNRARAAVLAGRSAIGAPRLGLAAPPSFEVG